MSCTLYLVRHGIADVADASTDDVDRRLTEDGARKIARAAVGLKRLGVAPDVVLASPLRRAAETGAALVGVLSPDAEVEIYAPLAPGHPPKAVLRGLARHRGMQQVMLVGHQPDLGELASFLMTGSTGIVPLPFKKGAVAAIRVASLPPRSAGELEWFLAPRQLRLIGRRSR